MLKKTRILTAGCEMKRFLDIFLSGIAILFFLPFFIPIMIILKFTGEGEIFYFQDRVGKNGDIFKLYKFATMVKNSPNIGTGELTVKNDPRILPFGRFLRKAKINELPQIFNVFLGDMSIIGPRPQTVKYFDYYPEDDQIEICKVRPGLSGLGSVVFRDEEEMCVETNGRTVEQIHVEDIIPRKIKLERWYVANNSIWLDIKIIFATIWIVFFTESRLVEEMFKNIEEKSNE
jgi:lipopolysaccharide/colanic/teichoic acid biosynthesis glycosyltransferase